MESVESIKWPSEFSELQRIDTVLKCGICYDYMKTAMITHCSHTYCSLCIRKFLQYSNKCPSCFTEAHESNLRNNRPLDSIVSLYLDVRDRLLRAVRVAEAALAGTSVGSQATPTGKAASVLSISSQPKQSTPIGGKIPVKTCLFPEESPGRRVPVMFGVSKPSPKTRPQQSEEDRANCPVCHVDLPARNINIHLDACLSRSDPSVPPIAERPVRKREPLPKRLYHLMADKPLRKCLKDIGLSVQGDRKVLINRIRRYTVLYNSECDQARPKSVAEIIQQVEREEKDERRKENTNPLFRTLCQKVDRNSKPDDIEKANKQYIDENRDNFKKLIESMRSRDGRNIRPLKPINVVISDDEGEVEIVGQTRDEPCSQPSPKVPQPSEEPSTSAQLYNEETICQEESDLDCTAEPPPKNLSKDKTGKTRISEDEVNSASSQDSVFDFPVKAAASSTPSRNIARELPNSPDPFSDLAVVEAADPNNLYRSVFEDSMDSTEPASPLRLISGTPEPSASADEPRDPVEDGEFTEREVRGRRGKRKLTEQSEPPVRRSRRVFTKKKRSSSPDP